LNVFYGKCLSIVAFISDITSSFVLFFALDLEMVVEEISVEGLLVAGLDQKHFDCSIVV
jgi:hypothetical protein